MRRSRMPMYTVDLCEMSHKQCVRMSTEIMDVAFSGSQHSPHCQWLFLGPIQRSERGPLTKSVGKTLGLNHE